MKFNIWIVVAIIAALIVTKIHADNVQWDRHERCMDEAPVPWIRSQC